MSERGLETIETTVQKTHEWIAQIAESDPVETVQNVLAIVANHIPGGEMHKMMDVFPRNTQSLFPALASAA